MWTCSSRTTANYGRARPVTIQQKSRLPARSAKQQAPRYCPLYPLPVAKRMRSLSRSIDSSVSPADPYECW